MKNERSRAYSIHKGTDKRRVLEISLTFMIEIIL